MHIGIQIEAPEGWQQLAKGETYHFLKNDATHGRVLLAYFEKGEIYKSASVHLITVSKYAFEAAAKSEAIICCYKQSKLPPWHSNLEGVDLTQLDQFRQKAKIQHSERVENRYLHIAPTIQDIEQIFSAKDPERELNRRAKLCKPQQHESRFRLWVVTYLCFGQDIWALLPTFHRIGKWDREKFPNIKFGAPSLTLGRDYGFGRSKELSDKCLRSYLKRAKLGKKMTHIYAEAMVEDFNCRITTSSTGMKRYESRDGSPFPTYWQFIYQIRKHIGVENVQKTLYGAVRHRAKLAASQGSFSEEVSNLAERVEADGYYTKERPKGYVEGSTLGPLCVVVIRDVLSGLKLGIGFSFGKENSNAYKMALFSMAVPKDYFCSLFGIECSQEEWPNVGLPGHLAIDRGPGARKDLIEAMDDRFPIKDCAPSWMGQSKSTIESSHPRDIHIEGQPSYLQSDFTPIELMRREIYRLISYNNTADMNARFDPDSEMAFVPPSPIGLWKYFDKLFRNDTIPISIDEAVRTFLTPAKYSIKNDGVWLDQRRYDSKELRETELLERVARAGDEGSKINGYMLDMALRYIWIEQKGRLIKLPAKLRIRGDEETTWISFDELEQWMEARRKVNSEFSVHRHAASSEYIQRFEENSGKAWDSTTRRSGKPKRNATSRQEEIETQQTTSKRKAA